ncbi:MAG: class I SAM-dependent methyltransferase [Solirubrobacterales bacterium]|nr:class I SAM-dependent methyltransferase [Solirubrobacterales bacterium]
MNSKYLQNIYAEMGQQLDPDEGYFVSDSRFLALEALLRQVPKGLFLDIGCGRGLLLRRLSDFHSCFGCDVDCGAVATCKKLGLSVCQVDLNAADELDQDFPKHFDVIVISEVCEHLLEPRSALRFAARYLKAGGSLIVTVPNAVPLFARIPLLLGRSVDWLHYPSQDTEATGHMRFYTIESMSRLLSTEGFAVEVFQGVSFRMNGFFWQRLCFWPPRLLGRKDERSPTLVDGWLGRRFPGFAPGLVFSCKRQEVPSLSVESDFPQTL